MPLAADHPGAIDIPRPPIRRRTPAAYVSKGVELSVYYGMTITPADVARVLNAAQLRYVIAGAHAANAHTGRPRATQDVDVLTDAPKQVADALTAAFPQLEVHDTPVVTRLFLDGEEAVDIMKAGQSKLFRRVVRMIQPIDLEGVPGYIPPVEGVLAMKFNAMTFLGRQLLDRQQDGLDFARVLVATDELDLPVDLDLLRELGELVYVGGGEEIIGHAADVRAGRPLSL